MAELLDAYDSYNDFERYAYFSICFDILPSRLTLLVPLSEKKENMEAVMSAIDFDSLKIKEVFKYWKTEDDKNADISKDFPYEYLLKSESKKLILWISLESKELEIDFLYDLADPELEKWVMSTNHILRTKFGEEKAPIFKVLSRNDRRFFTKDVRTTNFEALNIEELYNDDFQEIDTIILNSMTKSEAGLILFHGAPGTGKTTYLKNLISKFADKNFIFIQNEFIKELLHPDFISFLLNHRDSVLIIEDAEKVITSREYSDEASVVSTILQLTDGLFSDYLNIKIICTFNTNIEKIDKALFRKGRMIANYEFKPLSQRKTKELMKSLDFEPIKEEMVLADIFNFKKRGFQKEENTKTIGFK